MLKNCQKCEFHLGLLGTCGKLYFHEYLPKKIKNFKPIVIQAFLVFLAPTEMGNIKLSKILITESYSMYDLNSTLDTPQGVVLW